MKVALLIGERALRARLAESIRSPNRTVKEYPTAAKALPDFALEAYDLIVVHWKVYPGLESPDAVIGKLAGAIPKAPSVVRDAYYWEVGLSVIDGLRAQGSPNQATPVIVMCPDGGQQESDSSLQPTRESVQSDIRTRQPAEAIDTSSMADFLAATARHLQKPTA